MSTSQGGDEVANIGRVMNFAAGPSALPLSVIKQVQEELLNWNGTGVSVMEYV
jgi:phosphoserine aminotransferase